MKHHNGLHSLWKRGLDYFGCEVAILGGAMSWVSESNLVSALSNCGAFGVIAASSMPPHLLEAEIEKTKTKTTKPFGVNLIIMHPQLAELVEVCIRQKVSHVVLAGGIPKGETVKRLVDAGIKVIGFAPSAGIGRKLIKQGVSALVIEGHEAGGHIGPVSTSVLAQEILPEIRDVPVFVAGGIGRGEVIASFLEMGASGVQLGTRFVCAAESIAHPKFKEAFIRAAARDAMPSVQVDPDFPVIPVRAIANKASNAFTRFQIETIAKVKDGELDRKKAQLDIEHFWAGALRRAVIDGDVENGSLMAGQSVGMVNKIQPMSEIIAELVSQATDYLDRQKRHAA
jgi:enoyl-[acyl-carrier protein] reductase II